MVSHQYIYRCNSPTSKLVSSIAHLYLTLCNPRLQHARLPCPSPTPRTCSNSCPLSRWCHPTISSSVVPFSPRFNLSQHQGLFQWVSSSHQVAKVIGVSASASVLPMNIQDWSPLGWIGWISLQSKGLLRVFEWWVIKQYFKNYL